MSRSRQGSISGHHQSSLIMRPQPLPQPYGSSHTAGQTTSAKLEEAPLSGTPITPPVKARSPPRFWLMVLLSNMITVAILVPLFFAVFRCSTGSEPTLPSSYTVCNSSFCKKYATGIISSLSEKEEPCKHFYNYVCEGWKESNKGMSVLGQLALRSRSAILSFSRDLQALKGQPPSVHAAAVLLRKCFELQTQGLSEMDELKKIISGANLSWPERSTRSVDLLSVLVYWAVMYEVNAWFSVDIAYETLENKAVVFVLFAESDTCRWKITRDRLMDEGRYEDIVRAFLHESAFQGNDAAMHSQAQHIIDLEGKIIKDLCKDNKPIAPPANARDKWKTAVQQHLINIFGKDAPEVTLRYIPGYLSNVDQLISQSSLNSDLAYAITWTIVRILAPYFSSHLGGKAFNNQDEALRACIFKVRVIAGPNVERLFGSNVLNNEAQLEILRMFNTIQDQVTNQINQSTWLDSPTRMNAIARLRRIALHVALPTVTHLEELYHGFSVDDTATFASAFKTAVYATRKASWGRMRTTVMENLFDVNAYFFPTALQVVIALAMFQTPLYDPDMPKAVLYPALGHIFAHEMMHAFDANWHKYNQYAEMEDWWSPKVYDKYLEKTACIRRTHQNYRKVFGRQLLPKYDPERFADLAGVPALLAASRKHTSDVKLPGMEHFSRNEQFFIALCYAQCSNISSPEDAVHAPAEERCNVPLMNLEAFSEAFSCAEGDPMNPKERCTVW
ncbi:neprilysin-3-like [Ornithodoros turicata]|uniref:neprilysin-3-like n=1 Tax=Ornithodoros turicata TaxID=34597 RepID=UPI0031394C8C